LVSLSFKAVGLIMIIAALIDIVILPLPYRFQDPEWLLALTTQVVDRGIIPLLGVALFIAGNWVDSLAGNPVQMSASWRSLQFWVLILACAMSVLYLILTVVHVNSVMRLQSRELSNIADQAAEAEQQLDQRIEAEIGQRRQGVQQLLQSPEIRQQAIAQGAISEEDAQQLTQFEQNPEQLDTYLEGLDQQAETLRAEQQGEIGARREAAISTARTNALKSTFRIGLSSVLLAIGYAIVSWSGLRQHTKEA
ncbi:MAG: HpsJ family protein, partial [Elainellaceae cyanobacterium]